MLFTGTGVVSGVLSGIITEILFPETPYINFAVYACTLLILYLTLFLLPPLGIDMEKQGKWWKILLSNAFSYIIAWVVIWAIMHELNRY